MFEMKLSADVDSLLFGTPKPTVKPKKRSRPLNMEQTMDMFTGAVNTKVFKNEKKKRPKLEPARTVASAPLYCPRADKKKSKDPVLEKFDSGLLTVKPSLIEPIAKPE